MKTVTKNGIVYSFGYLQDLPDQRDFAFSASPLFRKKDLPRVVDLRDSGDLPPIRSQGNLGACHDAETEILTDLGWVRFDRLTGAEKLATVNPKTTELFYETPTRLVRLRYSGDLIVQEGRSNNFRVTPDHKMLVRRWTETTRSLEDDYVFIDAGELGWYSGLMGTVVWRGESPVGDDYLLPAIQDAKLVSYRTPTPVDLDSWLRFLGVFLADGNCNYYNGCYTVQIAATKKKKRKYVKGILEDLGITVNPNLRDRYRFANQQIYAALQSYGLEGATASTKRIPEFIFSLPGDKIRIFLDAHLECDGCTTSGSNHYTCSQTMADQLQQLTFLAGYRTTLTKRVRDVGGDIDGREITPNYPEYRVSRYDRKSTSIERKTLRTEPYDGYVYCAEVPTYHTLVTRRDGRILISGNCTGFALSTARAALYKKEKGEERIFSPLYIYYYERALMGTIDYDSGAFIRDGMKVLAKQGASEDAYWPYNPRLFRTAPDLPAVKSGEENQIIHYYRVNRTLEEVKTALSGGHPIVGGWTLYESMMSDEVYRTGKIPMPQANETVVGGHAMAVVGYSDDTEMFTIANSWGREFGDHGYVYMPYEYCLDFGRDFWVCDLGE